MDDRAVTEIVVWIVISLVLVLGAMLWAGLETEDLER